MFANVITFCVPVGFNQGINASQLLVRIHKTGSINTWKVQWREYARR